MEWAFRTIDELANFHISLALLISFTAGVITSFNPCMMAMATSITAFQGDTKKHKLSPIILAFMLSFATTLAAFGFVSSFFGEQIINLNESYGNIFYRILAFIFVLLGSYIIGLRKKHLQRLFPFSVTGFYFKQKKGEKIHTSPVLKAWSLGTLFGITPSPCTTPVVLAILAYITVKGSVLLGGLLLFSYGLGHGIPFLILGWITSALSRKGWMIRWYRLFNKGLGIGLILIGVFFYFYTKTAMNM